MIQAETLKAAGISEQDVRQLSVAWDAFQTAKKKVRHQTPYIVCTGIYNAGKSTLLNALAGREIFPTGDVPTTKKIAQAEFGGAVYVDTPGLNAMDEDDRETQAVYESADFILFVASAQNGGIGTAEAAWLQKLKERYSSLQQRLVYVLTHCTQVDPEQLPAICEKVCRDFRKTVGFQPEPLLCVDSITYQYGKNANKPTLVEHSGIPRLQGCLTERIASAEKTLREAQKAELDTRRQCVLEHVRQVKNFAQAEADKAAQISGEKISAVDAAWREFEDKLEKAMPEDEIYPLYCSLNCRIPSGNSDKDKSKGWARSNAESEMNAFYEDATNYELDKAVDDAVRRVEKYCEISLNSAYRQKCNDITMVLEKSILRFQQLGIMISGISEVLIDPNISSSLSDSIKSLLKEATIRRSLSAYIERETPREDIEYSRGLFGSERCITTYYYSLWNIGYAIVSDINDALNKNSKRANQELNKVWQDFRKNLQPLVTQRKDAIKNQVDAYKSTLTQSSVPASIQAALNHLDILQKEVSQ